MVKNTGQKAQDDFQAMVAALGKDGFLHRFDDAAAIRGKTGSIGYTAAQPSDYMLTTRRNGTRYVEVKSSHDKTAFRFSQLEKGQRLAGKQQLAAGGRYDIYVLSMIRDQWFFMPFQDVLSREASNQKSIPWDEMYRLTPEDL